MQKPTNQEVTASSTSKTELVELASSFFYALGRFAFGLLVHPYQTMQLLVEQKLFVWLAMLPTILLAVVFVLSRLGAMALGSVPVGGMMAGLAPQLYSFFSTWITVFCLYWQAMERRQG